MLSESNHTCQAIYLPKQSGKNISLVWQIKQITISINFTQKQPNFWSNTKNSVSSSLLNIRAISLCKSTCSHILFRRCLFVNQAIKGHTNILQWNKVLNISICVSKIVFKKAKFSVPMKPQCTIERFTMKNIFVCHWKLWNIIRVYEESIYIYFKLKIHSFVSLQLYLFILWTGYWNASGIRLL